MYLFDSILFYLFVISGDGTLAVFSYRKGKLEALSDNMEDELLNSVIVKVTTWKVVSDFLAHH